MRSSNPVFSRRGFSRSGGYAGFNAGQQPQAGNPYANSPYANNPYAQQQPQTTGQPFGAPPAAPPQTGRMTMDDVVARTGMTVGLVVVMAAVAWVAADARPDLVLPLAIGAGLVAMVLALVQSFKRKAVPALILAYAALEGLFLGAISNYVDSNIANGAAMQAVLGTMAVFAAVLVMYKTRIIRVTRRFYQFAIAAAIGFVLLMMVNLLFAVIGGGDGLGFRSGTLGIIMGVAGIVIGALFLALDFKQVEDGISYGAPREESWLAAFGLTLTLVWIYLEFLRLIAILQGND